MIDSHTDTPQKKAKFLAAMEVKPNAGRAARAAGIARKTAYRWREDDAEFAAAWDEAKDLALDDLEDKVHDIAQSGNLLAAFGYLKAFRENWREKMPLDLHFSGEIKVSFAPAVAPDPASAAALEQLKASLA